MENELPAYSKMVKISGVEEEKVREQIKDLLETQNNLEFTFSSYPGEVDICISSREEPLEKAKGKVKEIVRELKIRFGSSIFTTNSKVTLEETIVQLLKEKEMSITTVESCTGGLFSGRLTNVAGVSEVFKQGFVTYSNKAKRKFVGVKKITLKKYTAVSEQTAFEMARGGAVITGADVCVSITGYAGPDGGEDGQPVGLVYIGCNVQGKISVEEFHFEGDRQTVRELAVANALIFLRKCILENYHI